MWLHRGSSKLWMQRPLGPGAVDYAVGDVAYLIHIARYLNALDCRVALALSQVQHQTTGMKAGQKSGYACCVQSSASHLSSPSNNWCVTP
eukprot:1159663-Pelagomonas_calceolata.AAC.1